MLTATRAGVRPAGSRARNQLTTGQVRHGTWFDDAVARTAWPIELHDRSDGYVWEMFGPDHVR